MQQSAYTTNKLCFEPVPVVHPDYAYDCCQCAQFTSMTAVHSQNENNCQAGSKRLFTQQQQQQQQKGLYLRLKGAEPADYISHGRPQVLVLLQACLNNRCELLRVPMALLPLQISIAQSARNQVEHKFVAAFHDHAWSGHTVLYVHIMLSAR